MSGDLTSLLDLLERRLACVRGPAIAPADATRLAEHAADEMTYAEVVAAVRVVAATLQPAGVPIAIVSKGDPALTDLGGHPGWHLPQTDDGRYAGFHPKDGSSAIDHLERLRVRGAAFLMVPRTYDWWLTFYGELTAHLRQFELVDVPDGSCRVYRLASSSSVRHSAPSPGHVADANPSIAELHRVIDEQSQRLRQLEHRVAALRPTLQPR